MNNLLNAALVAILVVAGLVLFTPADEPVTWDLTPTPDFEYVDDVATPESVDARLWSFVGDEMIADNGDHHIYFPPTEPENKWAIVLLTHDDWEQRPDELRLVMWFKGGVVPEMSWFGSHAKLWHFTPSSKHYASYTPSYGTSLPVVAIQRFDGGSAYKVTGANIPKDCTTLYRKIIKGLASARPVKAIVQHRKKVRQDCPDGNCTPNRSRRPFSFLRPFRRPDDTDGNEPPPVDDPPPVDEPLVSPDDRAPIPDSDPVASPDEPKQDNSLMALLATIGGAMVGMFTKRGT
jgi:hypothetical protein